MQPGCLSGRLNARALAWLALAGVAVYVAIDVALAFLRPDYSLLHNAESDYGHGGSWAWLMDANFLLRCALSLAAAGALAKVADPGGRIRVGLALLAAWAVCSGLLAFFPDNLEGQPVLPAAGAVHIALALARRLPLRGHRGTGDNGAPAARPAVARPRRPAAYRRDPRRRRRPGGAGRRRGHKHAPGGLYERIFLGLELLWIALSAAHIAVTRSPGRQARMLSAEAGVPHVL